MLPDFDCRLIAYVNCFPASLPSKDMDVSTRHRSMSQLTYEHGNDNTDRVSRGLPLSRLPASRLTAGASDSLRPSHHLDVHPAEAHCGRPVERFGLLQSTPASHGVMPVLRRSRGRVSVYRADPQAQRQPGARVPAGAEEPPQNGPPHCGGRVGRGFRAARTHDRHRTRRRALLQLKHGEESESATEAGPGMPE